MTITEVQKESTELSFHFILILAQGIQFYFEPNSNMSLTLENIEIRSSGRHVKLETNIQAFC